MGKKNTTFNVRVQPSEDLIDFPVSDTFRDHFAAQGLTYNPGRRSAQYPRTALVERTEEINEVRRELSIWKSRLMRCQQENEDLRGQVLRFETALAKLQQELQRLRSAMRSERQTPTFEPVVMG